MTTPDVIAAAHARIPEVACQGHCRETCIAAVPMSDAERQRIAEAGTAIPPIAVSAASPSAAIEPCPALTPFGRCGVHAIRPTLCRLYGVAEGMECAWGCQPTGRLLTRTEAREVLAEVDEAGGDSDRRALAG